MEESDTRASSGVQRRAKPETAAASEPAMTTEASVEPAATGVAHGQVVIVTARWILIVAGLLLALWNPGPVEVVRLQVGLLLLLLAFANFYLHAQILRRRPALEGVVYGASAADIAAVTLLVAVQGGFTAAVWVFYLPALLALSVAFPTGNAILFAGVTMVLYATACLPAATSNDNVQIIVVRLLMMAAVAFCGALYQRIEEDRRRDSTAARGPFIASGPDVEAAEDVFFGQVVLIWARWFVIGAAAVLALWGSATTTQLTQNVLFVLLLMAMNFFLHGRYLIERPANRTLILALSAVDLLVITGIVIAWQSQFFPFYYPPVVAFGLVFAQRYTVLYTLIAVVAYVVAVAVSDSAVLADPTGQKHVAMRLISLAAMGALATYYWRIQRARRREAARDEPIGALTLSPASAPS